MAKRKRKRRAKPAETAPGVGAQEGREGPESGEALGDGGSGPALPEAGPALLLDAARVLTPPGIAAAALALLVSLFFVGAIAVPFLFDDAPVVTRNPLLWSFDTWWELVKSKPTRALVNLTFLVNYQLAHLGTAPSRPFSPLDWWSYHAVSLAIHALNTALLFGLLRSALEAVRGEVAPRGAHWVALGGAALWGLHPAHTMAVAYIAQRYALLGATAFFATTLVYLRLRLRLERGQELRACWPLAAGLVVAAASCAVTKENAVVAPLAVLGLEALLFRRRRWAVAALPLVPFVLGGLLALGVYGPAKFQRTFLPASSPTADRLEYFVTQIAVVPRYLHLFLLPHDLCAEQSYPILYDSSAGELRALTGAGTQVGLGLAVHGFMAALFGLLLRRGLRLIPLAIGWFYVANLVESSFIPILDPMVDHRMYLPTALLPAALLVGLARSWPALVGAWPRAQVVAPCAVAAVAWALGMGSVARTVAWASPTGIWEDTIRKRPDCARAYSSLGMEHLYEAGRLAGLAEEARRDAKLALARAREASLARADDAEALAEEAARLTAAAEDLQSRVEGTWLAAVGPIETALDLGPYHVEGWNNLGKAYLELERWREAELALLRGIEVNRVVPSPSVPLCWNNLGLVHIQQALRAPNDAARRRLLQQAVGRLKEAVRLDSLYDVAYANLSTAAYALMREGAGEERREYARVVVEAVTASQGVARRRGGDISLEGYRRRLQAWTALEDYGSALGDLGRLLGSPRLSVAARDALLSEEATDAAMSARERRHPEAAELLARVADWVDQAVAKTSEPSGALLVAAGRLAEARGDPARAARLLEAGLAKQPDHPRADQLRARTAVLRQEAASPPR